MFGGPDVSVEVTAAVNEASAVLDEDLQAASVDADAINDTKITQPLLLAAGVGTYRAWRAAGGPEPVMMAGHSLGEYAALVCAAALDYAEAVKLVRLRATAMQEAVPLGLGQMCAVLGLSVAQVYEVCSTTGADQVWPANINTPNQVVVAGHTATMKDVTAACQDAGAKRVIPLPVSVPSHCPLMAPASTALTQALQQITIDTLQVPVVQNATGRVPTDPEETKTNLIKQLTSPVDWVACVTTLAAAADSILECGPGQVLHNLNRRIVESDRCASLHSQSALLAALS